MKAESIQTLDNLYLNLHWVPGKWSKILKKQLKKNP